MDNLVSLLIFGKKKVTKIESVLVVEPNIEPSITISTTPVCSMPLMEKLSIIIDMCDIVKYR